MGINAPTCGAYHGFQSIHEDESIPKDVPRGHMVVYVGGECKRFVIRIALLQHPSFQVLLAQVNSDQAQGSAYLVTRASSLPSSNKLVHSMTEGYSAYTDYTLFRDCKKGIIAKLSMRLLSSAKTFPVFTAVFYNQNFKHHLTKRNICYLDLRPNRNPSWAYH